MTDPINPDHYKLNGVELIDILRSVLTPEEYKGLLKGSIYQYLFRYERKNGIEDLKKALWYLDKLLEISR